MGAKSSRTCFSFSLNTIGTATSSPTCKKQLPTDIKLFPLFALPPELIHEVLLCAVRARSLERALRLRLVSRAFDAAVRDAIFDSDMICDLQGLLNWPRVDFLCDYFAWRAFSTKSSTPLMCFIRRLAACMVRHRRGLLVSSVVVDYDDDGDEDQRRQALRADTHAVVRELVRYICGVYDLRQVFVAPPRNLDGAQESIDPMNQESLSAAFRLNDCGTEEPSRQLGQVLLSAAALLDDLDLVKGLVARGFNHYDEMHIDILPTPARAAAIAGNIRTLHFLLSGDPAPSYPFNPNTFDFRATHDLMRKALQGTNPGSPAVVDLILRLPPQYIVPPHIRGASQCHEILYWYYMPGHPAPLETIRTCCEHIISQTRLVVLSGKDSPWPQHLELGMLDRICIGAAGHGNVETLEYLLLSSHLPIRCGCWPPSNHMLLRVLGEAARHGRTDAVRFVLEQTAINVGLDITAARTKFPSYADQTDRDAAMSLLAKAAWGGSLRILDVILAAYEGCGPQHLDGMLAEAVAEALGPAVRREHDAVVSRLVGLARRLAVDTSRDQQEASRLGLESMATLCAA